MVPVHLLGRSRRLLNIGAADTVLITGGGPVGLSGIINAKEQELYQLREYPTVSRKQKSWVLISCLILMIRKLD